MKTWGLKEPDGGLTLADLPDKLSPERIEYVCFDLFKFHTSCQKFVMPVDE